MCYPRWIKLIIIIIIIIIIITIIYYYYYWDLKGQIRYSGIGYTQRQFTTEFIPMFLFF